MSRRRIALTLALACAACLPMAAQAQADKATRNALEGYFDFVDANAGTILPDLGRPQMAWKMLVQPHLTSPLVWDMAVLTLYLGIGVVDLR